MQVCVAELLDLAHVAESLFPPPAVAELFGLCAFGLLYPLPHVLPTLCVMAVTLGLQATLVYLSVNKLSGRALQFAIPASLLAVATVYLIFLAWHAFFPRRPYVDKTPALWWPPPPHASNTCAAGRLR